MNSRSKRGKVIVLTAPSGAGKTTVAHALLNQFEKLTFSTSATTRPPRSNEQDGVDYHFISEEEFRRKIDAGDFIEWETVYSGQMYGTLRSEVDKKMESGYFVLLDIDVKGALNVKQTYGNNCLTVFVKPPSMEALRERLQLRGSESEKTLKVRLERAKMELEQAHKFDNVIVNHRLEDAVNQAKELVSAFI